MKALAVGGDGASRGRLRGLLGARLDLVEAADAGAGMLALYRERPDVLVLDFDLPDATGFQLLDRVREVSAVAVVALVGRDSPTERARALRAGADDCVTKPVGPELVARIEAVLRRPRGGAETASVLADEFIEVDRYRHRVRALGVEVALTPTEFRMLVAFAENPNRVLGHGQLLDMVWGDRIRARDEVKLYVSYLRRKLGAVGLDPVETVRGIGYRYRPRTVAAPPGSPEARS